MRSSSMYLAVLVCGVADAFVAPRPAPVAQVLRRSSSEESAREEIALRNEESSDSLPPVSSSYQPVAAPSQLALAGLVAERCLGFAADRLATPTTAARGAAGRAAVVLGSGWGAAALVSALGESYGGGVTVVSPRNYFLFTPMLAGASVGTVEYRSICEPLRSINGAVDYLEATATRIDVERKVVVCEAVVCEGSQCSIDEFEVPTTSSSAPTGATTNTFGVPGVREHCLFLKQIADADALRQGLGTASSARTCRRQRRRRRRALLRRRRRGPTGVEFCGELLDFLESEALAFYPKLVGEASVTLLEATTTVLGAFDASLRDVAVDELEKSRNGGEIKGVDIRLGAAVTEVNGTHVLLGGDDPLPYGLCVWATGNGPTRVVTDTLKALGADGAQGDAQAWARGRFGVDAWLRVLGAPPGEVFAIGDCAADAVDFAAETKATLPRRPRSRPSRASTSRGC
ncbi:oxidoreductase [Aureococcus anophagefferens]|nr:oxidoreductase [Aureococcus anophagefferens]